MLDIQTLQILTYCEKENEIFFNLHNLHLSSYNYNV